MAHFLPHISCLAGKTISISTLIHGFSPYAVFLFYFQPERNFQSVYQGLSGYVCVYCLVPGRLRKLSLTQHTSLPRCLPWLRGRSETAFLIFEHPSSSSSSDGRVTFHLTMPWTVCSPCLIESRAGSVSKGGVDCTKKQSFKLSPGSTAQT